MPRSLRIQSTAKPKSNLSATIVLPRFSICHDCAAPLLITSSTRSASRPARCAKLMPSDKRLHQPGDADLVDHLRQLAGARPRPSASRRARSARAPARPASNTVRVAADHDRQLAVLGARLAAGHRRVEERDAARLRRALHLARDFGRRGRVVDENRAVFMPASAPPSPATARTSSSLPTHISTMSAPRAASAGVGADASAMLLDPLRGLAAGAVVDGDVVARRARDGPPSGIP